MGEKKHGISNLIIRSVSFLEAFIVVATASGCKNNKNIEKDDSPTTTITAITTSNDTVSSESSIESSISEETNEQTQSSNVETSVEEITATPDNNTKQPTISSNNQSYSSQSNQIPEVNKQTNIQVESPSDSIQAPSAPSSNLPKVLTADNINEIGIIDSASDNLFTNNSASFTIINYYYNENLYKATEVEYNFFILMLNNDYLNNDTYSSLFENCSLDDLKRYSRVASGLIYNVGYSDFLINYNNIVIDNNKKQFLNNLQNAIRNKNDGSLKDFVIKYFKGTQHLYNYKDDIVIDYIVNCAGYQNLDLNDEDVDFYLMNNYFDINDDIIEYVDKNIYQKYNGYQLKK